MGISKDGINWTASGSGRECTCLFDGLFSWHLEKLCSTDKMALFGAHWFALYSIYILTMIEMLSDWRFDALILVVSES